jgi:hypothetical protein
MNETDRQMERCTDEQTDILMGRRIDRWMDGQTDEHTDRQMDRQMVRQMDRQTDGLTDRWTDRRTILVTCRLASCRFDLSDLNLDLTHWRLRCDLCPNDIKHFSL